jgi:response regulator RpfG family c-di-GMP phosphodiesterase
MGTMMELVGADPLDHTTTDSGPQTSATEFLRYLVDSRLVPPTEVEAFLAEHPGLEAGETEALVDALVDQGLINHYQARRLAAGQTFGLVLGNYRVVDRIGAGGMGVVYKAEHIHMKRVVALKVLVTQEERDSVFLQRFSSEMQAMAVLRHPNIVLAFDAGEVNVPQESSKVLRYLVMEYVAGQDLEQYVGDHGPLPFATACDVIRQAASGLRHAYEHGLVHRDIKPSNLLLTSQEQVKILDFGLARLCSRRHTEAHSMLGTVDYMAPEQARDARSADIRADIYGLGGTLYWLLSGQKPFPGDRSPIEELIARQKESPRPIREHRPDIPIELEAIIYQMMANDPNDRYPTPLALITALNAFLEPAAPGAALTPSRIGLADPFVLAPVTATRSEPASADKVHRVLMASHDAALRGAVRAALQAQGLDFLEAANSSEARDKLTRIACDLILVDGQLPDNGAAGLCHAVRAEPPAPHVKIVLLASSPVGENMATAGSEADEVMARNSAPAEWARCVRLLLCIKEKEERADHLAGHLLGTNSQLEQSMQVRDADLYQAQDVLVFAMAKMAELRGLETGAHLLRLQGYVRVLAEEAARLPAFAGRIDPTFTRMLERCVLLHDIGKVAIPDHILLKPGRLDDEERSVMESHTLVGAGILEAITRQHGASLAFLQMATDIARHHHERFDGNGYPDGLSGESIPLAARMVTVADVYDALRSKLVYKPGLTHVAARRLLLDPNNKQFDPALIMAYRHCETSFEQIFEQTVD